MELQKKLILLQENKLRIESEIKEVERSISEENTVLERFSDYLDARFNRESQGGLLSEYESIGMRMDNLNQLMGAAKSEGLDTYFIRAEIAYLQDNLSELADNMRD